MRAVAPEHGAYERDLFAWTQEQAALLRARRADLLDWDHLAEEIESLGGRDRRELKGRLRVVLVHLLKWQVQPTPRGSSWRKTLRTQRLEIRDLLEQSPSLRRQVPDLVLQAYPDALEGAAEQTRLGASNFPPACPYTPEQVLDLDFRPESVDPTARRS